MLQRVGGHGESVHAVWPAEPYRLSDRRNGTLAPASGKSSVWVKVKHWAVAFVLEKPLCLGKF